MEIYFLFENDKGTSRIERRIGRSGESGYCKEDFNLQQNLEKRNMNQNEEKNLTGENIGGDNKSRERKIEREEKIGREENIEREENIGREVLEKALNCPLMQNISIKGCKSALIHIKSSSELMMSEVEEILRVSELIDPEAEMIYGVTLDPSLSNSIQLSLVLGGIPKDDFSNFLAFDSPKKNLFSADPLQNKKFSPNTRPHIQNSQPSKLKQSFKNFFLQYW